MTRTHPGRESGQTLVVLLIFMMLVIIVATAGAAITAINIRANNGFNAGEQSLRYAESGADIALQRLERDPSYTGETIAFQDGAATISVSGASVKTITSHGSSDNYYRTVTVTATITGGSIQRNTWSETP
jgi:hypothetical protein